MRLANFVLLAIGLSAFFLAPQVWAKFETTRVRLQVKTSLGWEDYRNGGYYQSMQFPNRPTQITEFDGSEITIDQIDSSSLTVKQITIPVLVRVMDTGLNLKVSQNAGYMKMFGISGKSVGDLFGRYVGVSASVAVAVNLGESVICKKDADGQFSLPCINDFESVFVGLGGKLVKRTLLILPKDGNVPLNIKMTVNGKDTPTEESQTVSYEDIKNVRLD